MWGKKYKVWEENSNTVHINAMPVPLLLFFVIGLVYLKTHIVKIIYFYLKTHIVKMIYLNYQNDVDRRSQTIFVLILSHIKIYYLLI